MLNMHAAQTIVILMLLGIVIIVNLNANGDTIIQNRIIGGKIANRNQFPYDAVIIKYVAEDFTGICGGSLITTKFVLTAAHCLAEVKKVAVALGVKSSYNPKKSCFYIQSTKLRPHEGFNGTADFISNDIGLIELPKSIKLCRSITTVNLPSKSDAKHNFFGYKAVVSGWGAQRNLSTSDKLKSLDVVVVPDDQCPYNFYPNESFCMLGKNRGRTCSGDSGSPVVLKDSRHSDIQIGIVSFGAARCLGDVVTANTKVTQYLNWIEKNSDYKLT